MIGKNNATRLGSRPETYGAEVTPAMIAAGMTAFMRHWTGVRNCADGALEEAIRDVIREAAQAYR